MPIVSRRADLGTEEVVKILRDGLGPDYDVTAGRRMTNNPFGQPQQADQDTILVQKQHHPLMRAQVTLVRDGGRSQLRVTPGGLAGQLVMNTLGIARQIRRVLVAAPGLR